MANYNSPYTGAEVDASVAKSQALPAAADVNGVVDILNNNAASSGDVLTADGDGGASWVTPTMAVVTLYETEISVSSNAISISGLILSTTPLFNASSSNFTDLLSVLNSSSTIFFAGMCVDITKSERLPIRKLVATSTALTANITSLTGSGSNQYSITTTSQGLSAYIDKSRIMFGQV